MKLATGGRGSGKTRALVTAVVHYATQWPGALILFCTPTFPKLQQDVLPVVWDILDNDLGLYKNKDYTYNKEEKMLEVFGCRIVFRTSEDPNVFRGPTAAAFAMDEAALSPLDAFRNLQATLRQRGYPHHAWLSSTPAGRNHWLAKLFVPEKAVYGPSEQVLRTNSDGSVKWLHWVGKTRDNPFGGEALYQSLIDTYGSDSAIARQELEGEFVLLEGLVFDNFRFEDHVVPLSQWPNMPRVVVAGVDWGFANPAAIVVYGIDHLKRRYVLDEFYKKQTDEATLIHTAKELERLYNIKAFVADSADPGKISAFRRAALPTYKAFKKRGKGGDLSSGIGLLYRVIDRTVDWEDLEGQKQSGQGFFIAPRCHNLIGELESYTYLDPLPMRNPIEKPRGLNDHAVDALRYAEAFVSRVYDPPISGRPAMKSTPIR